MPLSLAFVSVGLFSAACPSATRISNFCRLRRNRFSPFLYNCFYDIRALGSSMVRNLTQTPSDQPDLAAVREVVSDKIWLALVDSSAELKRLGVRHALIGGLAVGAYGYPRATKDVDFIVDDSGWEERSSGLVVMRVGLPVRAHGIDVDHLSIPSGEKHLVSAIVDAQVSEGVPVAPIEEVIYLKLVTPRQRDLNDIAELLSRGAVDETVVEQYLQDVEAVEAVWRRWKAAVVLSKTLD